MYRCEASTIEGFIQQIAVSYVRHGYYYYVLGRIPDHSQPAMVDLKIIHRYGLDISKWTRARRRKRGVASVQYLRYGRFFVLMATEGVHRFFERERPLDIRLCPLVCFGYRIRCYRSGEGKWRPSVQVSPRRYRELRRECRRLAVQRDERENMKWLNTLPYAPFGPVARQFESLHVLANRTRKRAGLGVIPASCLRRRRTPVKVFD